jgi:hypothetical protein
LRNSSQILRTRFARSDSAEGAIVEYQLYESLHTQAGCPTKRRTWIMLVRACATNDTVQRAGLPERTRHARVLPAITATIRLTLRCFCGMWRNHIVQPSLFQQRSFAIAKVFKCSSWTPKDLSAFLRAPSCSNPLYMCSSKLGIMATAFAGTCSRSVVVPPCCMGCLEKPTHRSSHGY